MPDVTETEIPKEYLSLTLGNQKAGTKIKNRLICLDLMRTNGDLEEGG